MTITTTVCCYFDATQVNAQAVISTLEMHVFFVCVCFTESRPTATFETFTPPTATTVSTETRKPLTTTPGTFVITDEASVFFLVSTARFLFKNFKTSALLLLFRCSV